MPTELRLWVFFFFLDLSSVVACGVKWDLAFSSLGWPVVLAVFLDYLAPRALMEYHL